MSGQTDRERPPRFSLPAQELRLVSSLVARRFDLFVVWRGGAGSPRPRRPPLFSLVLHRTVFVSEDVYNPMGWQQYSRPLWLSIGNHYILYLKAITVQIRMSWAGFPQRHSRAKAWILRNGKIRRSGCRTLSYAAQIIVRSRGVNRFTDDTEGLRLSQRPPHQGTGALSSSRRHGPGGDAPFEIAVGQV
jgi:hypothetical protein